MTDFDNRPHGPGFRGATKSQGDIRAGLTRSPIDTETTMGETKPATRSGFASSGQVSAAWSACTGPRMRLWGPCNQDIGQRSPSHRGGHLPGTDSPSAKPRPRGRVRRGGHRRSGLRSRRLRRDRFLFRHLHLPVEEQPDLFRKIHKWLVAGRWLMATLGYRAWTGTEDDWYGTERCIGATKTRPRTDRGSKNSDSRFGMCASTVYIKPNASSLCGVAGALFGANGRGSHCASI